MGDPGPGGVLVKVLQLSLDPAMRGWMNEGKNAVKDGLKQHCPNGVDVYFDNVGGDILDTVLTRINRKARNGYARASSNRAKILSKACPPFPRPSTCCSRARTSASWS